MKRDTRLDYRFYHVTPPRAGIREWHGNALLNGMPSFWAASEGALRGMIDDAHKKCGTVHLRMF